MMLLFSWKTHNYNFWQVSTIHNNSQVFTNKANIPINPVFRLKWEIVETTHNCLMGETNNVFKLSLKTTIYMYIGIWSVKQNRFINIMYTLEGGGC